MDDKLLNFFYKWHRFEQTQGQSIIDLDLTLRGESYPGSFSSRNQARGELELLIDEYAKISHPDEFITAKLKGALYYLRALEGESIPFIEYVVATMGVMPAYIPESHLQHALADVKQAYKDVGYTWDQEGVARYKKEQMISQKEIEEAFVQFRDIIVPEVCSWLDLIIELEYKVAFVDVDEYWQNWISTDDEGNILLRYNLNKRHTWVRGMPEFLVFHEICSHALQSCYWRKQIKEGKLHPLYGLMTVFTPEQFISEGVAESLWYFYPKNPFSLYGLVSLRDDHLFWKVWNNAHIMANEGKDIHAIFEFMNSYLPYITLEDVRKGVKEKTQDPTARTYQYIYGIALYHHMRIAKTGNEDEKKKYIRETYHTMYTPQQILRRFGLE